MTDDLTLAINDTRISGWTALRLTRGVERFPSDFDLELTERFTGQFYRMAVQPGDSCFVMLGDDVVLTGYIDRVSPSFDEQSHTIRVLGRGKCSDLVDCAAEWPGGQIVGSSVIEIAEKLVSPYSENNPIKVSTDQEDVGPVIPRFNLILGETPYSIIERICRYAALLVYEDASGNLVFTRAGTKQMTSGVVQGKNIQRATAEFSLDQRYSEVCGYLMSVDTLMDVGGSGNLKFVAQDPNVPRHRRMVVIAESGDSGYKVLEQRTQWELKRRFGRSRQLRVTVDSWRDGSGKLWEPNALAPISIPELKLNDEYWLISEVTYNRSAAGGTTADLVLMPPQAFNPQPITLLPGFAEVQPLPRQ